MPTRHDQWAMDRRKFRIGDRVYVTKEKYRNRPAVIARLGIGEYEVTFEDNQDPGWAVVETSRIQQQQTSAQSE
jgi:hypothetical protein